MLPAITGPTTVAIDNVELNIPVDVERGLLTADIRQKQIEYRVLRIARIDSQEDVAAELVGKLHHLAKIDEMIT